MSRYRVHLVRVDSASVVVEADSEDAALDAAYEQELPFLCAQCSGWGRGIVVDEGEWTTASEVWPNDPANKTSPDVELVDDEESAKGGAPR